ncbi:MAG: hypothetical protein Q9168_004831 [Polycauliona sp. 1 TL-2023]
MRFFSLTTLALASSFINPSLAAPASDTALVARQSPADAPAALAIVKQLYVDIKLYTGAINATASALTKQNTPANKAKASKVFTVAIADINKRVVKATSAIKSLHGATVAGRALESTDVIEKRQSNPADPTGLATTLTLILLEVGGALNNIIAILGLTATLSFLGPLVASLSGLLASLIPVVDNILILVGALVDGILGGLSLALAGLVL